MAAHLHAIASSQDAAPSVRSLVRRIHDEVLRGDLTPERASALLTRLAALVGNCNEAIRFADADYAGVLLQLLDSEVKANRARIRAETTPEYQRKREARDTKELVQEMIGSLKYLLRSLAEEMRLAR